MSMGCFVIAEAGVNHDGSLDRALELVQAAADARADAVKFQTFSAERIVRRGTPTASYQQRLTGESDQFELIRRLELSEQDHIRLYERCAELGIEFMSTPFDLPALDLLVGLGVCRLKIASGELTNRPFLERLSRTGLPLILSTGMGTLEEVRSAIAWISQTQVMTDSANPPLVLLHCTSNYPAAIDDANVLAMTTMAREFGLPVGYSDHTEGIRVSLSAVALGASVIEKHFTLDRSLPGPDHAASLEPAELKELVAGIREVERSLGSGVKEPRPSELSVKDLVRRSAFLVHDLPAGALVDESVLVFLRPGTGIGPERLPELMGRRLCRALPGGAMLGWSDLV